MAKLTAQKLTSNEVQKVTQSGENLSSIFVLGLHQFHTMSLFASTRFTKKRIKQYVKKKKQVEQFLALKYPSEQSYGETAFLKLQMRQSAFAMSMLVALLATIKVSTRNRADNKTINVPSFSSELLRSHFKILFIQCVWF